MSDPPIHAPRIEEPSNEQKLIISDVLRGFNVQINATAGAGKTTTLLMVARALANRAITSSTRVPSVLILTYNKALQLGIAERIAASTTPLRAQAYTYHACGGRAYQKLIRCDFAFV
jgi:superfamily II DNA/RNA helicase